jgi:hypothetical protein
LIDTPNSLTGTLGVNTNGTVGTLNATLRINGDNDLILDVVPEPSTWLLVISGLGGFLLLRRRR